MSRPAVLIPFKAVQAKSRLDGYLTDRERRELAALMLSGVLAAAKSAGLLEACFVITSDSGTLSEAVEKGAVGISESADRGVNSAISQALAQLRRRRTFMVLPSDLPLLTPRELVEAVELGRRFDCVISPSKSFDGTNLLIFRRDSGLRLSYDNNSFWNHIESAASRGLSLAVFSGRGFLFDVDSMEDVKALAEAKGRSAVAKFARGLMR